MADNLSPKGAAPAAAGLVGGGAIVGAITLFHSNALLFIIVLVVLLALLLGGYLLFVSLKKRKRSQAFSEGMKSSSTASPRNLSDPNKLRRLEELRQKFEEGVNAYRSRGKDLYTLPWYIIVGEAGGGKSEAIRHSNIGFPPGLQDELQGVGGTINMSWWFSDNAVLLDTAGRLIFEEAPPGESTEWKEFLSLLKTARPNCPINGMLLVIPCDSLIKDSDAELERKARKLAEQLDTIQRVLDIRFPVSVLVTKCDLLVGFREYFEDIKDPRLQHQIFGWSNPDKLDSPFRAQEVDRYLQEVGHRLGRRRLRLLRDPAPENPSSRRADEVDTLYALPHRLAAIAPRLRRYLDLCFQQGAWSLPPLFLRGIYFSSALREGAPLDAELASALGVAVDSLSEFKFLEREKSFFLKDLFVEKMFKERGLVTRATNTRKVLKQRKLLLYGGATAALVVFLLFAWMGMHSFKTSVAAQSEAWRPVAQKGWVGPVFGDSLVRMGANGVYEPVTNPDEFNERQTRLGLFHEKLREQATNQVKLDFISRLFFFRLASRYEKESLDGQRIVFETGVIKPLVDAARQKASTQTPPNLKAAEAHAGAVSALLQLEAGILTRWNGTNNGKPSPAAVQAIANPLSYFVAGAPLDTNLVATWAWLYNSSGATLASQGRGTWPPDWISDYVDRAPQDLRGYPTLRESLRLLYVGVTNSLSDQVKDWASVSDLYKSLRAIADVEQKMIAATKSGMYPQAESYRAKYVELANALDEWMRQNRGGPLFQGEISLVRAQENFKKGASGSSIGPLARVDLVCSNILARQDQKLFTDVHEALLKYEGNVAAAANQMIQSIPDADLKALDASYLAAAADRGPGVLARRDVLQTIKSLDDVPLPAAGQKVGREGFFLQKLDQAAGNLTSASLDKTGLPSDFRDAAGWLVKQRTQQRANEFLQGYLSDARALLAPRANWPLGGNTNKSLSAPEVADVRSSVGRINQDLKSPDFDKHLQPPPQGWDEFRTEFGKLNQLVNALVDERGVTPRVKVTILAFDGSNPEDAWRRTLEFAAAWGAGDAPRIGDRDIRDKDLGTLPIDREIEITCSARAELKPEPKVKELKLRTRPWGA
ncbi:MAG TPA: type VI secretion protein IcmF/TssM N-terminal domain-containing protein, partial [Verrucomicrobiae bacterium]|nr:type VI secretion protein IcmF/TssM N-terminal domain-containing protein [Verrucomicrobiae bacterium]